MEYPYLPTYCIQVMIVMIFRPLAVVDWRLWGWWGCDQCFWCVLGSLLGLLAFRYNWPGAVVKFQLLPSWDEASGWCYHRQQLGFCTRSEIIVLLFVITLPFVFCLHLVFLLARGSELGLVSSTCSQMPTRCCTILCRAFRFSDGHGGCKKHDGSRDWVKKRRRNTLTENADILAQPRFTSCKNDSNMPTVGTLETVLDKTPEALLLAQAKTGGWQSLAWVWQAWPYSNLHVQKAFELLWGRNG